MTTSSKTVLQFLALVSACAAVGCRGGAKPAAAPAPPPVIVGQVVRRTVPVSLRAI